MQRRVVVRGDVGDGNVMPHARREECERVVVVVVAQIPARVLPEIQRVEPGSDRCQKQHGTHDDVAPHEFVGAARRKDELAGESEVDRESGDASGRHRERRVARTMGWSRLKQHRSDNLRARPRRSPTGIETTPERAERLTGNVNVRFAYHVAVTAHRNEMTRPPKRSAPKNNARVSAEASTIKPNAPTIAKRIHEPSPGRRKPCLGLGGTFAKDRQGARDLKIVHSLSFLSSPRHGVEYQAGRDAMKGQKNDPRCENRRRKSRYQARLQVSDDHGVDEEGRQGHQQSRDEHEGRERLLLLQQVADRPQDADTV